MLPIETIKTLKQTYFYQSKENPVSSISSTQKHEGFTLKLLLYDVITFITFYAFRLNTKRNLYVLLFFPQNATIFAFCFYLLSASLFN